MVRNRDFPDTQRGGSDVARTTNPMITVAWNQPPDAGTGDGGINPTMRRQRRPPPNRGGQPIHPTTHGDDDTTRRDNHRRNITMDGLFFLRQYAALGPKGTERHWGVNTMQRGGQTTGPPNTPLNTIHG